jgi:hypothetical protein
MKFVVDTSKERTMTDVSSATLEQRVRNIERELRRANERVAALVEQRQRVTGARFRVIGGITVVLMVVGFVVPTPGAAPATFTAPFTVTSPTTKARFVVDENTAGTGLVLRFYNAGGAEVVDLGVETSGIGGARFQSPDGTRKAQLGVSLNGQPFLKFDDHQKTAELDPDGVHIWNSVVEIADLGILRGNGHLLLADAKGVSRVEAGTEENDDGAVKVYGPTGKCLPSIAGIPCRMVAK